MKKKKSINDECKAVPPSVNEFDEDIRNLKAREDIQGPEDICREEYKKADELMQSLSPGEEKRRGIEIMIRLAGDYAYPPAIFKEAQFEETVIYNKSAALRLYKQAADLGHGEAACRYADILAAANNDPCKRRGAVHYYLKAIANGYIAASEKLARLEDME